ncbi:MAG: hypothetical protein ACR5LC_10705 [Symbiopectobacterium sp.]
MTREHDGLPFQRYDEDLGDAALLRYPLTHCLSCKHRRPHVA